jgi:hypothetical protein
VPFVVVTDNLGRPVASGIADQASTADERLRRSTVIEAKMLHAHLRLVFFAFLELARTGIKRMTAFAIRPMPA